MGEDGGHPAVAAVLAWLRARSGSIWPACLAHAGTDLILAPLTTAPLLGHGFDEDGVQLLVVVVLIVVAAPAFMAVRPIRPL